MALRHARAHAVRLARPRRIIASTMAKPATSSGIRAILMKASSLPSASISARRLCCTSRSWDAGLGHFLAQAADVGLLLGRQADGGAAFAALLQLLHFLLGGGEAALAGLRGFAEFGFGVGLHRPHHGEGPVGVGAGAQRDQVARAGEIFHRIQHQPAIVGEGLGTWPGPADWSAAPRNGRRADRCRPPPPHSAARARPG